MITKVTSDLTQKAPFHPELKPIRELKTTTKPYYVKALCERRGRSHVVTKLALHAAVYNVKLDNPLTKRILGQLTKT